MDMEMYNVKATIDVTRAVQIEVIEINRKMLGREYVVVRTNALGKIQETKLYLNNTMSFDLNFNGDFR